MRKRPNMSKPTLLLLQMMLEEPLAWRHGYDISKSTGLKSGTMYPLLMRLSDGGYLASRWKPAEQPGRPPRHLYRLTAAGLKLAREVASERRAMTARSKLAGAAT